MTFSIYLFLILVVVLSMDAFTAGLSYGMEGVQVPFLSIFIIALLSGSMLTASLLAGNLILKFIPKALTKAISFSILFLLSLYKFYDSFPHCSSVNTPATSRQGGQLAAHLNCRVCDPRGIRQMSASQPPHSLLAGIKGVTNGILHFFRLCPIFKKEEGAQFPLPKDNNSAVNSGLTTRDITRKINKEDTAYLSYKEAAFLALALSIDNISAGLCTGTISLSPLILLFLTTAVHFLSIRLGLWAGHLLCAKSHNFAWLGAVILMLLAFLRLF